MAMKSRMLLLVLLLLLCVALLLNLLGILLQLLLLLGALSVPLFAFVCECLGFLGIGRLDIGGPCTTLCRVSSSIRCYFGASTNLFDGSIDPKVFCHLTLRRVVAECRVVCSPAGESRTTCSDPVFAAETCSQAVVEVYGRVNAAVKHDVPRSRHSRCLAWEG